MGPSTHFKKEKKNFPTGAAPGRVEGKKSPANLVAAMDEWGGGGFFRFVFVWGGGGVFGGFGFFFVLGGSLEYSARKRNAGRPMHFERKKRGKSSVMPCAWLGAEWKKGVGGITHLRILSWKKRGGFDSCSRKKGEGTETWGRLFSVQGKVDLPLFNGKKGAGCRAKSGKIGGHPETGRPEKGKGKGTNSGERLALGGESERLLD